MKNNRPSFEKSKAFTAALEAVVPGGAHTYSKGRDQFPLESPSGIVRGKGARLWDADGNCFVDWSMGLTSVSIGHADAAVNRAVCESVEVGVNFQRPAALELEAARAFLAMAGTDMVKFAKHGSVVTTAAVKLARAFTGRSKVAVPREHPFFSFDDWFIGMTPADIGIPEALKQFTVSFSYNDIDSLKRLFSEHPDDIACVMLEPVKFEPPLDGFLHKVRDVCTANGALMILDEMITGLKIAVPGAARFFGVDADLYTYGKGIANGYACTAVTGKGDIMRLGSLEPEGARKLFLVSTTHGAESTGLAAMIKTFDLFRSGTIVEANWSAGRALKERLSRIIARHGLGEHISLQGYPCLMYAQLLGPKGTSDAAFTTLFMQEMIALGVLFQGIFMLTPSHGESEFADTERAFDSACGVYRQALDQGSVEGFLVGPPIKPVFRRFK